MRRQVFFLLAALLAMCLCGCGSAPSPAAAAEEESPDMETGLSATLLESRPRPLTEEEILAAYCRAEEAYGWFDLSPLPNNGETAWFRGAAYRQVDYPGLTCEDELRSYLRSLFSAALTDQLLALGGERPYYKDVDGALCVSFSGREREGGKGASFVEVVEIDSQTYSLEVSVELLEEGDVTGLECWSFPYAYEDGRWVFTDFRLVS